MLFDLSGGTDEYGTATERKAQQDGLTCQEVCDKYYPMHAQAYSWFNISFNHFGRTTTPHQTAIAQEIFNDIDSNGYLLEQEQEQLYCATCKRFLADRFVFGTCPNAACGYADARGDQCDKCGKLHNAVELIEPKCDTCKHTPQQQASRHLFLDLKQISQEKLHSWFTAQSVSGAWSDNAIAVTRAWFDKQLEARCITRDLQWGTPVPKAGFTSKVFYVWFDAPIGYLSITANYTPHWRKWWQSSVQDDVQLYPIHGQR